MDFQVRACPAGFQARECHVGVLRKFIGFPHGRFDRMIPGDAEESAGLAVSAG